MYLKGQVFLFEISICLIFSLPLEIKKETAFYKGCTFRNVFQHLLNSQTRFLFQNTKEKRVQSLEWARRKRDERKICIINTIIPHIPLFRLKKLYTPVPPFSYSFWTDGACNFISIFPLFFGETAAPISPHFHKKRSSKSNSFSFCQPSKSQSEWLLQRKGLFCLFPPRSSFPPFHSSDYRSFPPSPFSRTQDSRNCFRNKSSIIPFLFLLFFLFSKVVWEIGIGSISIEGRWDTVVVAWAHTGCPSYLTKRNQFKKI